MQISMSTDSRNAWERMRRRQLWELGTAWGISYPSGATKDQMISILSANSVNPLDPKGAFEFEEVHGEDENGRPTVNRYPKRKIHATANKDIDYAQIMEAKTQTEDENKSLKEELGELKALVESLVNPKEAAKEAPAEEVTQPAIADMKFHEMKALAKKKGLKIPNTMKKPELIKELEAIG